MSPVWNEGPPSHYQILFQLDLRIIDYLQEDNVSEK